MRKIAVLTSGGDAPGMNAALRAVVRKALYHDLEVLGIRRGYQGLLEEDFWPMNSRSVSDILQRGGTILKTARCRAFLEEETQGLAVQILEKHGVEALIVIGGDGSFQGAKSLSDRGIRTIGIPGTIDNDLGYTDYTIGFDTALTTVMEAVSRLRDTSSSHGRVFVVEVMGRNCGDLALYAGLISGADTVLVPEIPWTVEEILESLKRGNEAGKSHHIILVSEGIGDPQKLTLELEERSGQSVRLAVIGHLQRGGSPSSFDRLLATRMGSRAIDQLLAGETGVALGIQGNQIISMDIDEAVAVRDRLNLELYQLNDILSH